MTREDFIKKIAPYAIDLGNEFNILPSLIMGVGCHESNFGDSQLAEKGNNLYGVKGTYNGDSVTLPTWEVENGVRYDIDAKFRKYPSYKESMRDFCNLIKNGVSWNKKIYHSVIGVEDWEDVIEAFAKTPYMTDPAYFGKLRNITESYKLYEYNQPQEATEDIEPPQAPETEPEATPEAAETDKKAATPDPTATAAGEAAAEPVNDTAPEAAAPEAVPEEGEVYIEYPKTTFKVGSKGNYVKMIQERIGNGLKVDGHFGSITAAYVTVFQVKNDLVPDGLVGEATWHVLFNHK